MECVKTQKSLLFYSSNALRRVLKFHKDLSTSSLKNKEILKDLQKYGPYSFRFILLECGDEWSDINLRKKKLRELKRKW